MVARLGGDEFIVAVPIAIGPGRELADRVVNAFRLPFAVRGHRVLVTASVGVVSRSPGATRETLVRDADAALYQAKDAGRDRVAVFDEAVRRRISACLAMESDLRAALQNQEIRAHYQPIFDVRTGTAIGVEALARWQHAQRGWVSPAEFIPVAEETGLVLAVGDAMLDAVGACYDRINGSLDGPAAVAWVNVSCRQLEDPSFAGHLIRRVEQSGLMGRIGFEITETALTRDNRVAEGTVHRLAAAGFLAAIDDFGTGYSSLARLAQYPVHMLKIDRSFVEGLSSDAGTLIVSAIVDLAHAIGAKACAEGVETPEQLAILCDLGVDEASGYYLCRPGPVDDLASGVAGGRRILADRSCRAKP
jgi:predicted signal transduction protein with EAL and GGDEF domain